MGVQCSSERGDVFNNKQSSDNQGDGDVVPLSLVPIYREGLGAVDGLNLISTNVDDLLERIQAIQDEGKRIFDQCKESFYEESKKEKIDKKQQERERDTGFQSAVVLFMQSMKLSKKLLVVGEERRNRNLCLLAKLYEGKCRMLIGYVWEEQGKNYESIEHAEMAYHTFNGLMGIGDLGVSEESIRTYLIFSLGILFRCYSRVSEYEKSLVYCDKYIKTMKNKRTSGGQSRYVKELKHAEKAYVAMSHFLMKLEPSNQEQLKGRSFSHTSDESEDTDKTYSFSTLKSPRGKKDLKRMLSTISTTSAASTASAASTSSREAFKSKFAFGGGDLIKGKSRFGGMNRGQSRILSK